MSYVGNAPAVAYTNTVKDTFSGDNSTVAFTLSVPTTTNNVRVVVENVIQDPTVAYSVSGTTLTFTSAPPSGTNNIYVVHLGPAVQTVVPPDSVTITDLNAYADGAVAFTANRASSDGTIIDLQKGGSTVGSIGVDYSTRMYIGTGGAGVFFNSDVPTLQPYSITSGDVVDNSVDLGASATRFKNLYLSGGVYLGGTGSANLLDDYEEGTWTPSLGGNTTYSTQQGSYTKVGRFVYITGRVAVTTLGTGSNSTISGLPFTSKADNQEQGLSVGYFANLAASTTFLAPRVISNNTTISAVGIASSGATMISVNIFGDSVDLIFSGCYEVA